MPTYTSRGLPLYSDTEAMPGWDTGYNAQSTALNTALDNLETDIHDADSVATFAALPLTGNWLGRLVMTEDTGALYKCTALPGTWRAIHEHRRQDDTTNSVIEARVQSGIGKITGSNTTTLSEAVTFPVAFSAFPVVMASFIGYRGAGAFNPAGLTVASAQRCGPMAVTASGFTVKIDDPSGSFTSSSDWYYQWIAIGAV